VKDSEITGSVQRWVESFVVELNLCPFAKRELIKNRIRFALTAAQTEEELLTALQAELELLDSDTSIETTLLIHAKVLHDFCDYNQFLVIHTTSLATPTLMLRRTTRTGHPIPCCI